MLQIIFILILCFTTSSAFAQSSSTFNNNMEIVSGNAAATNNGNNSITMNGGQQLPPTGMIAIPQHQAPSVFQSMPYDVGMPAELMGINLEVFYDQVCNPEESDGFESSVFESVGASKLTQLTITTHPKLSSLQKGYTPSKVGTDLTRSKKFYHCLGIMTAVADKEAMEKGKPVGLSVLTSDMRKAVRERFTGIAGNITILSDKMYWGGAMGVSSSSSGASIGVSLVNIVSRLTSLGMSPGLSGGTGASAPTARSGITALILVEVKSDDPGGIEIGLAVLEQKKVCPQTPSSDDSVKKNEADKH